MCTRTFYLPKDSESKIIMNRIVESVACSIEDIKTVNIGNKNMLRFSINCATTSLKTVLRILHDYGYIE